MVVDTYLLKTTKHSFENYVVLFNILYICQGKNASFFKINFENQSNKNVTVQQVCALAALTVRSHGIDR